MTAVMISVDGLRSISTDWSGRGRFANRQDVLSCGCF